VLAGRGRLDLGEELVHSAVRAAVDANAGLLGEGIERILADRLVDGAAEAVVADMVLRLGPRNAPQRRHRAAGETVAGARRAESGKEVAAVEAAIQVAFEPASISRGVVHVVPPGLLVFQEHAVGGADADLDFLALGQRCRLDHADRLQSRTVYIDE